MSSTRGIRGIHRCGECRLCRVNAARVALGKKPYPYGTNLSARTSNHKEEA